MGCLHIYCGDGKGKTTAAVGLSVRMAGSGGRVVLARFLKNDQSGEVDGLRQIDGISVLPCEKTFGFTWHMTEMQRAEAEKYYTRLFDNACVCARMAIAEEAKPTAEEAKPTAEEAKPTAEEEKPTAEVVKSTAEGVKPTAEVVKPTAEGVNSTAAAAYSLEDDGESGKGMVLLVLDELCAAMGSGFIGEQRVIDFLDSRPGHMEVVMTGRNPSEELLKRADYISEIKKIKHPFDYGLTARKGIEY